MKIKIKIKMKNNPTLSKKLICDFLNEAYLGLCYFINNTQKIFCNYEFFNGINTKS